MISGLIYCNAFPTPWQLVSLSTQIYMRSVMYFLDCQLCRVILTYWSHALWNVIRRLHASTAPVSYYDHSGHKHLLLILPLPLLLAETVSGIFRSLHGSLWVARSALSPSPSSPPFDFPVIIFFSILLVWLALAQSSYTMCTRLRPCATARSTYLISLKDTSYAWT